MASAHRAPETFRAYLSAVYRAHREGYAREHAYRPALKDLIEAIDSTVEATNEPKRQQCGAPDFIVTRMGEEKGYSLTAPQGVNVSPSSLTYEKADAESVCHVLTAELVNG